MGDGEIKLGETHWAHDEFGIHTAFLSWFWSMNGTLSTVCSCWSSAYPILSSTWTQGLTTSSLGSTAQSPLDSSQTNQSKKQHCTCFIQTSAVPVSEGTNSLAPGRAHCRVIENRSSLVDSRQVKSSGRWKRLYIQPPATKGNCSQWATANDKLDSCLVSCSATIWPSFMVLKIHRKWLALWISKYTWANGRLISWQLLKS